MSDNSASSRLYRQLTLSEQSAGTVEGATPQEKLDEARIEESLEALQSAIAKRGSALESSGRAMALRDASSSIIENAKAGLRAFAEHGPEAQLTALQRIATEAIIRVDGSRPAFPVQGGKIVTRGKKLGHWAKSLKKLRAPMETAARAVGRIGLFNKQSESIHIGTAFAIDRGLIATNRHVVEQMVSDNIAGGRELPEGAHVDFAAELGSDRTHRFRLTSVEYAGPNEIGKFVYPANLDLAILRCAIEDDSFPSPLTLASDTQLYTEGSAVMAIGFPAEPRLYNGPGDLEKPAPDGKEFKQVVDDIFTEFGVKYCAPGLIELTPGFKADEDQGLKADVENWMFTHDISTLAGNSGSALVEFDEKGKQVIGLHVGGFSRWGNFAHSIAALRERPEIATWVPVQKSGARKDKRSKTARKRVEMAKDYAKRDGYQPDFLGETVPLPRLNPAQAMQVARTGDGEAVLNYRHFSVVMNRSRRFAYFVAANMNGAKLLRRSDNPSWPADERLAPEDQAQAPLYNDDKHIDRLRLMRRLSVCWGTEEVADKSSEDTSTLTNLAALHKTVQTQDWNALDEHILDLAGGNKAKLSIFAGCIFADDDPYRGGYRIPRAYWKVIAARPPWCLDPEDRAIESMAFVLSQHDILDGEGEAGQSAFADGDGLYQVSVALIERLTGLDFPVLRAADAASPQSEQSTAAALRTPLDPLSAAGSMAVRLRSLDKIVHHKPRAAR